MEPALLAATFADPACTHDAARVKKASAMNRWGAWSLNRTGPPRVRDSNHVFPPGYRKFTASISGCGEREANRSLSVMPIQPLMVCALHPLHTLRFNEFFPPSLASSNPPQTSTFHRHPQFFLEMDYGKYSALPKLISSSLRSGLVVAASAAAIQCPRCPLTHPTLRRIPNR